MQQNLVIALDTAGDAIALAVGELCEEHSSGSQLERSEQNEPGKQNKQNKQNIKLLAAGDMLARREANVCLVPAIDRLFAQHGLDKEAVKYVVCGRGPGSFTGVRIAVATAKGLAAGLEVPLHGVVTQDAQAWQAWLDGVRGHIAVLSDAMRGEVYPVRYKLDKQGAKRVDPLTVIKANALAEKWQGLETSLVLAGDALYKYKELFSAFALLEEAHWRPRGSGLLKAFEELPRDNGSLATLLPVYTRLSDAEENERKRLASGGAIAQGALTEIPASGVAWPLKEGQKVFRPAAAGDIASMVALERSAYGHPNSILSGECWTEPLYKADIGLPSRSWWVCYQDNALVGFIGGQLIDGQIHVLDVVVGEPYRRQGIALQLMEHLAQDAKDLGATEITLEVRASNAAAQVLYTSLGLAEVGRRKAYYSPLQEKGTREDALVMTGDVDTALLQAARQKLDETGAAGEQVQEASALLQAKEKPLILAIESSCDETAAALVDGQGLLLRNVVASQTNFHARFGGVVPEIASRKHTEAIYPTVKEALGELRWQDLDAIAVTYAPGLIGALVVGMAFAKGLAWSTGLPLIKVDHLEGHIYANRFVKQAAEGVNIAPALAGSSPGMSPSSPTNVYRIEAEALEPPFVIALLSGGNTLLVQVRNWGEYVVLGETLDDAVGEAYDKVAKALGLGYPGGPIIARLAAEGDPKAVEFPRALLHSGDYRFSLSGLKTAVLTVIRQHEAEGKLNLPNIAASFEQAVIEVQVAKALRACENLNIKTFCIGGGVAANKALREAYKAAMEPRGIRVVFPPPLACTDNAAMIAAVALDRFMQGKFASLADDAAAKADLAQGY